MVGLEAVEQTFGPVRAIDLVRVVEERVGHYILATLEGAVEAVEIFLDGDAVIVVHHISLASGSGTFHLLEGASREEGIDCPVATLGSLPVEDSILIHLRCDIETALAVDGHDLLECGHGLLLLV